LLIRVNFWRIINIFTSFVLKVQEKVRTFVGDISNLFSTKLKADMKKKILFIATLVGMAMFTNCQRFDFDEARQEAVRHNAEQIFGEIDPNQTWSSSVSGTVTITADASLKDIARVQILTESPFMNPNARVVAEAKVQKGQTVTLDYDVLNSYNRLIAACVDSKGRYHIKGFDIGETNVSFKSGTTRAARRAASNLPDFSNVVLSNENTTASFNALRELNSYNDWKNSNWKLDRLYAPADVSDAGNSWTIGNQTIYADAIPLTEEEQTKLQDTFNEFLTRDDKNGVKGRKNNLEIIRNSNVVTLYNNELTTTGEPITLRPVQMASTEAYWCDIYYYYYNPSDVASSGLSEADYIKTLPKFKAIDLDFERAAFSSITGIAVNQRDQTFLRLHQYLLPYYGDISDFQPTTKLVTDLGFTTNGNVYRIQNKVGDFYMTYTEKADQNLKSLYEDGSTNADNQLWQLYTKDDLTMLYNVGAKQFLFLPSAKGTYPAFSTTEASIDNYCFKTCDQEKNARSVDGEEYSYIWEKNLNRRLKKASNTRIGADEKTTMDDSRRWIFHVVTTTSSKDATLDNMPQTTYPDASAIIPAGYKIGFMIRKSENSNIGGQKNGCLYGYGELNKQINKYGQFKTAVSDYGMLENDPRIAMFEANGKTYLTFEEGADAQFSDVIVEMGGYDTDAYDSDPDGNNEGGQGVATSMLYSENEITGATYMLLFEDRATSADYDMNDVVLRCIRQTGENSGRVELSLVAAGGMDDVVLMGIQGTKIKGYDLNEQEVHEIFDVEKATGYDRFVNTVEGQQTKDPCKGVFELPEGMTIPQFLANIYIVNKTTGDEIRVPTTGAEPLAIIMPFDFKYPKERQMITGAYKEFLNWAQDATGHTDWYNHFEENTVYPIDNIISK
jgi:hypothetical protein